MNLHGGTIHPLTLGAIICLCAAPAMTLNVWPRIENMILHGMTSNELGIALLVAVSALGMTAVPFAMLKAPNRAFWWTTLSFGLGLATLNYIMAVGAIGKISDHATSQAAQAISRAQSLKDQLEDLRAARKELGAFKHTSQEQLTAADEAVRLAEIAQRDECGKVGDHCRARVAQLQSRLSERADISAALSATIRRSAIERDLRAVEQKLLAVGALPTYTNPQAERIRSVVGLIAPSVATESVANGIIHFLAIAAELFALGMPRILSTALAGQGAPKVDEGAAPPEKLNIVRTPNLAVGNRPRALPAPSQPAGPAEWRTAHLFRKPGNKLKCWDTYKLYEKWTRSAGQAPVSFTAFDFELTSNGVKKEAGSRSFYLDVDVKIELRVVA